MQEQTSRRWRAPALAGRAAQQGSRCGEGATPACLSSRALSGRVRGWWVLHSRGLNSDSRLEGPADVWARRMALPSWCRRPSGALAEPPVLGRVPTDSTLGQVGRAYRTPQSVLGPWRVRRLHAWLVSGQGRAGGAAARLLSCLGLVVTRTKGQGPGR